SSGRTSTSRSISPSPSNRLAAKGRRPEPVFALSLALGPPRARSPISDPDPGCRERSTEFRDLLAYPRERRVVVRVLDGPIDPRGDQRHLALGHAARRDRRRAETDAARIERLARIVRHRVVVALDARLVKRLRRGLAVDAARRHVDQNQVIVGAAGDQPKTALAERFG